MTPKTPQENKALAQARTLKLLREKLTTVENERDDYRRKSLNLQSEVDILHEALLYNASNLNDQIATTSQKLDTAIQQRDSTQQQYQSAIRREQNLILAHAQLKNEATMRLERWGKHTLECAKRHRLGPCDCGFDGAKVFV